MAKVLALAESGEITYCSASPEMRGKGRCNHIAHKEEGETDHEFIARIESNVPLISEKRKAREELASKQELKDKNLTIDLYRMSDEEKENLTEILGRNQLGEDIEGGYIHLDTPLWNDADKKAFVKHYGFSNAKMQEILNLQRYAVKSSSVDAYKVGQQVVFTGRKEDGDLSTPKYFKAKYGNSVTLVTGVALLNELAAEKGFEATKDVYVLPYYMRQNPPAGPDGTEFYHPLNSQYNLLLIKRKNPDAQQIAYEQLVNNKDARIPVKRDGYISSSLSTLLTGKPGVMRREMSGRSIEYSGRAVITPDIDMEYGSLGLPPKMISHVFRPTIREQFQKAGWDNEKIDAYMQRFDRKDQENVTAEDRRILQLALDQAQVRVIGNRQPTLFNGSLNSFRPVVSPDQTVKVSPLNLANYAADHDGDTFSIFGINSRKISEYSKDFSSESVNGIRTPNRLDKSSILPQKEALFGLLNILQRRS